ncbi:hypothetical protein NEOLEDRAFT_871831 [Neolentinus lepideus HHB14362 ss-1]|uniref:Uncharacterized protein n=1 Tax=Neolentinus lepideus HHB14362 ss-1 TaxID=1314782 RepID=A0A165P3Z2_9AGAM|nr:hypothetical protein NEOLEDRAFT_871831 [Neolentinus lepideus HHB14362 ss-1]
MSSMDRLLATYQPMPGRASNGTNIERTYLPSATLAPLHSSAEVACHYVHRRQKYLFQKHDALVMGWTMSDGLKLSRVVISHASVPWMYVSETSKIIVIDAMNAGLWEAEFDDVSRVPHAPRRRLNAADLPKETNQNPWISCKNTAMRAGGCRKNDAPSMRMMLETSCTLIHTPAQKTESSSSRSLYSAGRGIVEEQARAALEA